MFGNWYVMWPLYDSQTKLLIIRYIKSVLVEKFVVNRSAVNKGESSISLGYCPKGFKIFYS